MILAAGDFVLRAVLVVRIGHERPPYVQPRQTTRLDGRLFQENALFFNAGNPLMGNPGS